MDKRNFKSPSLFFTIIISCLALSRGVDPERSERRDQKTFGENSHTHSTTLIPQYRAQEGQSTTTTPSLANDTRELKNCTPASIEEFPKYFFNQHQRQQGAIIINFAVVFYMFWATAIICDNYFVPCLEIICDKMGLQTDVAGATFMAFGSSAPELFISVIGVFVTKGDIGIGTILGSAVFNVLFVIGVCGVAAGTVLYLAWWPLVRDMMFYLLSIVFLVLVLRDNVVIWPEATAMACSYSIYLLIMYFNPRIEAWLYKVTNTTSPECKSELHASNGKNNQYSQVPNDEAEESEEDLNKAGEDKDVERGTPEEEEGGDKPNKADVKENKGFNGSGEQHTHPPDHQHDQHKAREVPSLTLGTPWSPPEGIWPRICWVLGLPINISFYFTIPNVKKESCQKYAPVAFIVCIFWIAFTSYILVWMVTIIGYTFTIPDSVMGLSLLAFGTSVPDSLSSIFVARKGDGDMAVSHTVGSNMFDILLGLGIPWLIKGAVWDSAIVIDSHGLFLACFFILGSITVELLVIYYFKWVLDRKVGCIHLVVFFIFMGISIYVEMKAFARYNLPMCIVDI